MLDDESGLLSGATPADIEGFTFQKPAKKVVKDSDLAEALEEIHKDPVKGEDWREYTPEQLGKGQAGKDSILLKDALAEVQERIEANRLERSGQAFEKFIKEGILGPITSYEALVQSGTGIADVLKTMTIDGQPLTYEQQYKVLSSFAGLQLKINPPITDAPVSRVEKFIESVGGVGVGVNPAIRAATEVAKTVEKSTTPVLKRIQSFVTPTQK